MKSRLGSVLLEGVLAQGLVLLSLMLAWEICRRSVFEVSLQHAAFLAARASVLGEGRRKIEPQLETFLERAVGAAIARKITHQIRTNPLAVIVPGEAVLKYRFPAFIRFPIAGQWKHHFEMTKSCRFPISY